MSKAKTLFLMTHPNSTRHLTIDKEMRAIEQRGSAAKRRNVLIFQSVWTMQPDDVLSLLKSLTKVEQIDPLAAEVLRLCAFLAPDAIPEELLGEALKTPCPSEEVLGQRRGWFFRFTAGQRKQQAHPPLQERQIDEAIALLQAYSLIQRNATRKTLSIHRLMQTILRESLPASVQRTWMQRAVQAVHMAFPAIEVANWSTCERLLPHALTCATWIERGSLFTPEAARLLNQAGYYLSAREKYVEAEPLYQRALATHEQVFGVSHPDTMTSLNNLAALYNAQGQYRRAEPLYQRALAIHEQGLGTNHPDTMMSLNNLAMLYRVQRKYGKAEPLYQRALAIREQGLGTSHPDTTMSLNNLAALYRVQGKYAEAEPLYQRALAIREQQLGASHSDTATSLNNLALLYDDQGRYGEAEPLYLRALTIFANSPGQNQASTACVRANYATLLQVMGRVTEADELVETGVAPKRTQEVSLQIIEP